MPPLRLREFTAPPPPEDQIESQDDSLRLAAYEEGYAAGWEDAVAASTAARSDAEAEAIANLRQLSVTVDEARQFLLSSVEPLLTEMTTGVLPQVSRESPGPLVLQILMPLVERAAGNPIRLRVSAEIAERCEALAATSGLAIKVATDTTLSGGVVFVTTPEVEARIDLEAATAAIRDAVRAFFRHKDDGASE